MPSMVATAQHDLVALALSEVLQHISGLVVVQVHQDRRHDLRVFVAQQLRHRQAGPSTSDASMPETSPPCKIAVNQQSGLVVAQRQLQHRAHVVAGVGDQQALRGR